MPVLRSRQIPSPAAPPPPSPPPLPPKTLKSASSNHLQPPTPSKITEPLSPPTALPRRRSLRRSPPSADVSPPKRTRRLSASPGELKGEVSTTNKRQRSRRNDAVLRTGPGVCAAARGVSVSDESDGEVKKEEESSRKSRSWRRYSREEKGKGEMSLDDEVAVLGVNLEEGEFNLNQSPRKFTREEKGKAVVIDEVAIGMDLSLGLGSANVDLSIGLGSANVVLSLNGGGDPETYAENETSYLDFMEFPHDVGEQVPNDVGEGVQIIDGRRAAELSAKEWSANEYRASERMERFKNVARDNASRFAHFVAPDTDDEDYVEGRRNRANVEGEGEVRQEQQAESVEDWPGPFSTAMKIIRDREKNLGGKGQKSSSDKGTMPLVSWTMKEKAVEHPKRVAPSLQSMCLKSLAENVDLIGSLNYVPDALRHSLCQLLCDSRRMNAHFFSLLLEGAPSEVCVADCSWLEEEEFEKSFQACDTSKLTVLQLDLCGHCISDSSLIKALRHKGLPALVTISLKGACRISDAGLKALVSAAPSLRSMNLSQCTLLTDVGIESIADSLGSILHELYLDDCDTLDALRILPALQRLECLEVLSLRGIGGVSDKFINELITSNGRKMKELLLANCRKLTDASLKVIAETCSELCVLDISYLRKLTDIGMAYLSNGCRKLQDLKLCRNTFSDDAIAAFLETSGETLKELSLNNIPKVGQNTTLSIAKRCKNLESLDLSWCRSLTDDALGLIADSCSSLRLLKIFGFTQITKRFIDGHSNPHLQIIGMKLTPILDHIKRPDFQHGPLRYSAVPSC